MDISQFLLILRARKKSILITLFVTVSLVLGISLVWPKSYKATTSLVLNYKGIDPVTGMTLPAQLMPGYMATQVDIITSQNVALKVIDRLKLADSPAVKQNFLDSTDGVGNIRDWLAELLLRKLDVVPARESSVLDVSFKGADPQFAAVVANAFAAEYQLTTIQLKAEPLQKAANYFNGQIKTLRDNLEAAQSKLSKYQQEKGIVSFDNRVDVESSRLNDLSTQLVIAQGQSSGKDVSESADVASNGLIQNLKALLVQAQSRFSEISERLGPNHPQYQGAKAEVEKLRSELDKNMRSTSEVYQRRKTEVGSAFAAQKSKVLQLNRARDELAVLGREVDSAQRAYDATMQRFNQTSLEGQSNQTDVSVLNPATPPIDPYAPRILLNTLVAIFLGTVFGVIVGVILELLDRRVRSADDLADALGVPVLGTLAWQKQKQKSRAIYWFARILPTRLRSN